MITAKGGPHQAFKKGTNVLITKSLKRGFVAEIQISIPNRATTNNKNRTSVAALSVTSLSSSSVIGL
ncbi:hypothetical protein VNO78_22072 [Psophocarpus tetragonolobus]|uniref:Uncharacterized protein n=1 Tax=Psophocarpus tetragonolobus TaxID=3891 RepID=A0AAN9SC37_PSOTE